MITIALLQMTACGDDQDANLAKGETFCRRAREMEADVALLPEMWNVGYTFYDLRYGLLRPPPWRNRSSGRLRDDEEVILCHRTAFYNCTAGLCFS